MQDPDALTVAELCRDLALLARTAADRLDDTAAALTQPAPAPAITVTDGPPGAPTPTNGRIVLAPAEGLTFNPGPDGGPDRAKLARVFEVAGRDGQPFGFWADPSTSLAVNPDGRLAVVFNRDERTTRPNSGGSSWVNAAVPLPAPLEAARLSMWVRFGTGPYPWEWGTSGKLPGLMSWHEGRSPGGGEVAARNWSVRPCWNDWDRDGRNIRLGPYVYGRHTSKVPEQIWGTNAGQGTLRWGAPVIAALEAPADAGHAIDLDIEPTGVGTARVTQWFDGVVVWAHEMRLAAGPAPVTHLQFTAMYGGDSLDYGPRAPVTALEIVDLTVTAL